jgi:tRNA threonylcarbamoyladenosine biosynthesis protein TsaE
MLELKSISVSQTKGIGKIIGRHVQKGDIVCLFGELGCGKTVLTKGIAKCLGLREDKVISPTFVIIRQYDRIKIPLFHFDLYRLKTPRDILALGYEEYLYGRQGLSVIEWADRLGYLLPKEFLKVELSVKNENSRLLRFVAFGKRHKQLLARINEDTGN